VFGERHLRHVLLSYLKYYNEVRTHLSLEKDAPVSRAVERAGRILCRPVLGGHHLADINFRSGFLPATSNTLMPPSYSAWAACAF